MSNRYIISLGGSLIVPDEIDVGFLRQFKSLIESEVKKGNKFILITGGGKTSRRYSEAAKNLGDLNSDDLDWLGIHSTRLNGHLLRTILRKIAHPEIITNPKSKIVTDKPVIIAAGYRPGWSTDYDAVLLAEQYKANILLNLSNIDYVYDKNPKKYKNAKPLKQISWRDFRKIVGSKWDPGLNLPFDPVASKLGEKLKLKVAVLNGKSLKDIKKFLANEPFKGTIIG
ncbi:MAG: UMP kinase [Candidatus Doudnabacteria bacterium]|nr:UMP kinase [Candidatus Doudnabacteria bacterium]